MVIFHQLTLALLSVPDAQLHTRVQRHFGFAVTKIKSLFSAKYDSAFIHPSCLRLFDLKDFSKNVESVSKQDTGPISQNLNKLSQGQDALRDTT